MFVRKNGTPKRRGPRFRLRNRGPRRQATTACFMKLQEPEKRRSDLDCRARTPLGTPRPQVASRGRRPGSWWRWRIRASWTDCKASDLERQGDRADCAIPPTGTRRPSRRRTTPVPVSPTNRSKPVDAFLDALVHARKDEIEAVRALILGITVVVDEDGAGGGPARGSSSSPPASRSGTATARR